MSLTTAQRTAARAAFLTLLCAVFVLPVPGDILEWIAYVLSGILDTPSGLGLVCL